MTLPETLDVWLDGVLAGHLTKSIRGVEFAYDTDYRSSPSTTPLSLSMPKHRTAHAPATTEPWIENLIPEGDEVRRQWARSFGDVRTDAFTLLSRLGIDAPGAVQIVPAGVKPEAAGEYRELSQQEIAGRVRRIKESGVDWIGGEQPRFSLAGQQAKFALARVGDAWLEPSGRAPSTHIIKPGIQGIDTPGVSDQATEFVTMRAAHLLGLPTADVSIEFFEGIPAFVTKRYDRVSTGATVLRVHQEDLCQVLSVEPGKKYQADGGPGIADVGAVLTEWSSDPGVDRARILQALLFNLVTAGIDGHAKNYSLLLRGGEVRLAPLYDLISAHGIWDEDTVNFRAKMAMRYGKEYRLRGIDGRNMARMASELGMDGEQLVRTFTSLVDQAPGAFVDALGELPDVPVSDRVRALPESVEKFGLRLQSTLGSVWDQDIGDD